MSSPVCQQLTEESSSLVEKADYHVSRTSFVNLLDAAERDADPPVWKVNAVVLLTLYPVVVLTLLLLNPLLTKAWTALSLPSGLAFGLTVFLGNVIGVAATGFWLVPWAARLLDGWLVSRDHRAAATGTVAMIAGYAGLIATMSFVATWLL
jgi:antibiotic biosynthesis monooxygenase (ABM) superfamily enzyme